MHRLAGLIASCLLAAVMAAHAHAGNAPGFKVAGDQGDLSLSQYQGKVVYLDFWASWCTPCRKSFPWMNDMQRKYGAKGLQIVAINLDQERRLADRFLAETPAGFAIGYDPDGKVAEQYHLKGVPSSFLIDRQGNIAVNHAGFRARDSEALEAEIRRLLDAK